jgi:hypothetical protein
MILLIKQSRAVKFSAKNIFDKQIVAIEEEVPETVR